MDEQIKTKTCKYCQSYIAAKAKICPNCGKKQKGIGKWIIIAVVIIVIIAAAGSGSDDDEPKKVGEVSGSSKTGSSEGGSGNAQNQAGDNDGENGNGDNSNGQNQVSETADSGFNVGDIVESENLRITFVSTSDYTTDNEFMQPKDGYKYIQAEFEFENIGKDDEYVSEFDFSCYADGYNMDEKYFDSASLSATLSSGKKTKGAVYFEVPVDAKEIILEYETNYWTEKKVVFNVLKTEGE